MNKKMFASRVSKTLDCTLIEAEKAIAGVLDTIKDALASGNEVNIHWFGSFKTAKRSSKNARNPRTMEKIIVNAYTTIVFKAWTPLKKFIKDRFDK